MLTHLNAEQRAAVKHLDSPLLVLAGAGSGKTRVITHKIAHLITDSGYAAKHIAAITFTNKAAREMQERLGKLIPATDTRGLTVTTFHSLGLRILRSESARIGLKPSFSIMDAADSLHILSGLAKSADKAELKKIQWRISLWKNAFVSPGTARELSETEADHAAAAIYEHYQETLRAYQAVDFDDLIRIPVDLLERDAEALEKWRYLLRYLLVDEYQDTNTCQYRLLKSLCGESGAFTAVGDDDQAIYAWRGASAENLRALQQDFSALRVIKLEQNYRSTLRILRAANSLIAHNSKLFEKRLWSELGHGDPISVVASRDEESEAQNVVMRLLAHKFEHRTRHGDYAILYRGNHQARVFEQALRNEHIPYRVSGGTSFFERTEIKDLIAYLRLIANGDDDPAFIRAITTPRRGVGAQTLEKLGTYAGQRGVSLFEAVFEPAFQMQLPEKQYEPVRTFCDFINRMEHRAHREPSADVLDALILAIDYEAYLFDSLEPKQAESRWANVTAFLTWLKKKSDEDDKRLGELTQLIALITMLESRDESDDVVTLSTLHAAKGLEFDHVFLIGLEEGLLPHKESIDKAVEEERRLMYVGITRARKSLSLSYCEKRKRGGEWHKAEPSRFINELAQDDLRFAHRPAVGDENAKAAGNARLQRLKAMLAANAQPE